MTAHTVDTTTLADSRLPGYTTVVQARVSIAINLGSGADAMVTSALAPAQTAEEPSLAQIESVTGAHDTAQIDNLVSDADEFTSMPPITEVAPATGDPGPPAVQANGAGDGHTTLIG